MKWLEAGEEAPGWCRAHIDQYFQDGSRRIVYDDSDGLEVSEVVTLMNTMETLFLTDKEIYSP